MLMRRRAAVLAASFFLSLSSSAAPLGFASALQDDADPFSSGGTLRLAVGNGLTALVVADSRAKEVAIRLEISGGAAADPAGKEGLAALALAALLGERSGAYPGGEIEPGPATATLRFRVDSSAFGPALGALAARLAAAGNGVAPESFEAAKRAAIDRAKAPGGVADRALTALLFGVGHPSARAWAGSADTLASLRLDDAKSFLGSAIPASRATLAMVGPIVGVDALAEIPIRLAAWPGAKIPAASATPAIPRQGRRALLVPADTGATQHEIRAAFLLPPRSDARLSRAAAAAATALRPPAGIVPGSFQIRIHGRRADSSVLVLSFRVSKPEDAAAALGIVEKELAGARAALSKGDEKEVAGVATLPADLRAALALLESNPDDDGLGRPAANAATSAIDLDAWVAVVAGPASGNAESSLRASGFAVEKR